MYAMHAGHLATDRIISIPHVYNRDGSPYLPTKRNPHDELRRRPCDPRVVQMRLDTHGKGAEKDPMLRPTDQLQVPASRYTSFPRRVSLGVEFRALQLDRRSEGLLMRRRDMRRITMGKPVSA